LLRLLPRRQLGGLSNRTAGGVFNRCGHVLDADTSVSGALLGMVAARLMNSRAVSGTSFGHSLGQELQKRGLHYTPHYTLPLMGRYRHDLVDQEAGVYRYDHLIVLHTARMPAVLLEAGSIINRQEELDLATPGRRLLVAEAVAAAVEEFCASRIQVAGQPPVSNPASIAITRHARGVKPASLSRHKHIHSAKT
jgi:hypothetical protein